jgi:hypothetical protein
MRPQASQVHNNRAACIIIIISIWLLIYGISVYSMIYCMLYVLYICSIGQPININKCLSLVIIYPKACIINIINNTLTGFFLLELIIYEQAGIKYMLYCVLFISI